MSEPITTTAPHAAETVPPPAPTAIARPPAPAPREVRVVVSDTQILDTGMFEQMQRIAAAMAESSIIPDHLVAHPWWDPKNKMAPAERMQTRDKLGADEFRAGMAEAKKRTVANCFLVVEQAVRWGMSPFAVAPETYVVGGKLAFQGKLVLAVVNELAGLEKRLDFDWSGEGKGRQITIRGRFKGDPVERVDTIVWDKVKTDNKMWQADPDQKLLYTGVLHWARRWCPEVVLGVKTVEDLERIIEEETRTLLPRFASSLDTFAAAGAQPAALATPPIEVSSMPDDMRAADSGIPEPQGEQETAEPEAAAAPVGGADPVPRLSATQLAELRKLGDQASVPWEELERRFGGPLEHFDRPNTDAHGLERLVVDEIRRLAAKKK